MYVPSKQHFLTWTPAFWPRGAGPWKWPNIGVFESLSPAKVSAHDRIAGSVFVTWTSIWPFASRSTATRGFVWSVVRGTIARFTAHQTRWIRSYSTHSMLVTHKATHQCHLPPSCTDSSSGFEVRESSCARDRKLLIYFCIQRFSCRKLSTGEFHRLRGFTGLTQECDKLEMKDRVRW